MTDNERQARGRPASAAATSDAPSSARALTDAERAEVQDTLFWMRYGSPESMHNRIEALVRAKGDAEASDRESIAMYHRARDRATDAEARAARLAEAARRFYDSVPVRYPKEHLVGCHCADCELSQALAEASR